MPLRHFEIKRVYAPDVTELRKVFTELIVKYTHVAYGYADKLATDQLSKALRAGADSLVWQREYRSRIYTYAVAIKPEFDRPFVAVFRSSPRKNTQ